MLNSIPLTHGKFALVDESDRERLLGYRWYYYKDVHGREFAIREAKVGNKWKTYYLHRDILGITDPKIVVDHIDGNCLDNRRSSLRACANRENSRNQKRGKSNTSGYKGVTWHKGHQKWYAQTGYNYKKICVGDFDTPEEAARAYDAKAIELFGKFARTNFPSS